MTEGWAFTGGPPTTPSMSTVSLVEGRCFCVSEPSGDIGAAGGHGLVVKDTRFLDHLELRVDGEPLESLTVEHTGPHAATFVTRRRPRPGLADSTLLVVRRRYVGNGMVEDVTLENLSAGAVTVTLTLTASTDFAGLFDVKEGRLVKRAEAIEVTTDDTTLRRRIDRADSRAVEISATGEYQVFRHGLIWHLTVPARATRSSPCRSCPSSGRFRSGRRTSQGCLVARATPRGNTDGGASAAPSSRPPTPASTGSSATAPRTCPVCASPTRGTRDASSWPRARHGS